MSLIHDPYQTNYICFFKHHPERNLKHWVIYFKNWLWNMQLETPFDEFLFEQNVSTYTFSKQKNEEHRHNVLMNINIKLIPLKIMYNKIITLDGDGRSHRV